MRTDEEIKDYLEKSSQPGMLSRLDLSLLDPFGTTLFRATWYDNNSLQAPGLAQQMMAFGRPDIRVPFVVGNNQALAHYLELIAH